MENSIIPGSDKTSKQEGLQSKETIGTSINPPLSNNEPPKPKTEQVDVSKMTEEDKNLIDINWETEGKENKFFHGPTQPVPEADRKSGNPSSSAPSTFLKGSSFETGITVLILVLDFLMSNVLWKIAGEGKASTYSADAESKRILTQSMCALFEERKTNMPIWLVVLLAFLAAYGFQIMGAIQARKGKQSEKKPADNKSPLEPGLFELEGKLWRRYANGSVREAKFDANGNEIVIGQPSKMATRRKAA